MTVRAITEKEWNEYKWIQVGPVGFVRGVKRTRPPADGYHYVEITTYADIEQKWRLAITEQEEGENDNR